MNPIMLQDAGRSAALLVTKVEAIAPVKNGGFSDALQKQSFAENSVKPATANKTPDKDVADYSTVDKKNLAQNPVKDSLKAKNTETDLTPEEETQAIEVIASAIAAITDRIVTLFEVEPQELETMMQELNLVPEDLLDKTKLGELLLEVSGVPDSLSLLTDEKAYDGFKECMEAADEALQEIGTALKMQPKDVTVVIKDFTENAMQARTNVSPVKDNLLSQTPVNEEPIPETGMEEEKTVAPVKQETAFEQNGNNTNTGTDKAPRPERISDKAEQKPDLAQAPVFEFKQPVSFENLTEISTESREIRAEDIMRQIMDFVRVAIKPEVTEVEMQLHPASLGNVQVQISNKAGMITAQFTAQDEAVKAAIEGQLVELKERFEEQGIKVQNIEVNVQTNSFNEEFTRGQQEHSEEAPKQRTRRINLAELSEEMQLTEEEELAAKLMEQNGNTVDYMA